MRDILFRAWNESKKRFETNYDKVYMCDEGDCFVLVGSNFNGDHLSRMNVVVQFYIGKEDVNGNKIHEGDIIDIHQTVNGQPYFFIKSLI